MQTSIIGNEVHEDVETTLTREPSYLKKERKFSCYEKKGRENFFFAIPFLASFICREGRYILNAFLRFINRIKFDKKKKKERGGGSFPRFPSISLRGRGRGIKMGRVNGGNISYNSMCPHGLLI